LSEGQLPRGRKEPEGEPKPKPFEIPKPVVYKAYKTVKANKGAAGVDGESIEEFDRAWEDNMYKLWNRMSSGSYFPPPVRAVEIPKPGGRGVRTLGVPTVADRIAQTVAKQYLEPIVEPLFHEDSYGYRPGRSPLDAVGACRKRCWEMDWVIDLDIEAFFDTLDHELMMKAVRHHTSLTWIHLYVERWLKAPLQREDGTQVAREKGSPQGSAISPLLANIFMHHAFDMWMRREHPSIKFERYCDDVVVHCVSEHQAQRILAAITRRLAEVKLTVNAEKTRIVYCRDANRRGPHEKVRFDFLGYEFRPRSVVRRRDGERFVGFVPAVSEKASKRLRQEIRGWRLHLRSGASLEELAEEVNQSTRGWSNHYGRYYPSRLAETLRRINDYLVRWAQRKYKRLSRSPRRAWALLRAISRRDPTLFHHWTVGARP
jgi:RNA-directed DNA polymerase